MRRPVLLLREPVFLISSERAAVYFKTVILLTSAKSPPVNL